VAERGGGSGNLAAFTRLCRADAPARGRFADTLPPAGARWYRRLGERSDREFASWADNRLLDEYLETAGRIPIRACGVLALAYLYIAYGYPRILADSFRDEPELSRERRHRAYVLGGRLVWQTLLATSKSASILGAAGAVMRLLPGDRPLARLAADWYLAHRCAAWSAAEALAASDDRAELEARLWAGIERARRVLLGRSPLRWIRQLPFSCDLVSAGVPPSHAGEASTGHDPEPESPALVSDARGGYRYLQDRETVVAARIEDAFALLARPDALALLDPPWTDVRFMRGPSARSGPGAEREFVFRWSGVPLYLLLRISEFEPPHRLVIEQALGPWREFRIAATLRSVPGGTAIVERTDVLAMPGAVDHALHRFVVARQLRAIDAFRHEALLRHLGAAAPPRGAIRG